MQPGLGTVGRRPVLQIELLACRRGQGSAHGTSTNEAELKKAELRNREGNWVRSATERSSHEAAMSTAHRWWHADWHLQAKLGASDGAQSEAGKSSLFVCYVARISFAHLRQSIVRCSLCCCPWITMCPQGSPASAAHGPRRRQPVLLPLQQVLRTAKRSGSMCSWASGGQAVSEAQPSVHVNPMRVAHSQVNQPAALPRLQASASLTSPTIAPT